MSEVVLSGQLRQATGKSSAQKVRRAGQVPGVLYGTGREPTPVAVDARQLERLVQGAGAHGLIDLQLDNGGRAARHKVLIKDLQRDPVYGAVQHVDFHAVALDQELETTVAVEPVGSPPEGLVNVVLRELAIACLPAQIPESIPVDVSGLEVGTNVTVQDLAVPAGVTVRHEPEELVLTITRARVEAAPEAEEPAAEEAAEEGAPAGEAAEADRDEGGAKEE